MNAAQNDQMPVVYEQTTAELEAMFQGYEKYRFDSPEAYDHGVTALRELSRVRNAIDKRRKKLNEEALEHQRRVNHVAKQLTAIVERYEVPLKLLKAEVDSIEERRVAAEVEAARLAEEERLKMEREVADLKAKQEREAEQAKLAADRAALEEQRRAQDAELAKVRAELDAARAKADADARLQQLEIQRQRDEVAAERQKIEDARVEQDRAAALQKAKEEAVAQAERDRVAAAERAEAQRIETERVAAERAAQVEAMKPDAAKLVAFAKTIRATKVPRFEAFKTNEAREAAGVAIDEITAAAAKLEAFAAAVTQ